MSFGPATTNNEWCYSWPTTGVRISVTALYVSIGECFPVQLLELVAIRVTGLGEEVNQDMIVVDLGSSSSRGYSAGRKKSTGARLRGALLAGNRVLRVFMAAIRAEHCEKFRLMLFWAIW